MKLFLIAAAGYILGYAAHALYLGRTVYGDGIYYYAWLSLSPSKYAVGPALIWAPVYLATHNQFAVGFVNVCATIFALLLLWNLLQSHFNKTVSLMTILAIVGASNLLFYGSLDAANSHALSFFAATVFLVFLCAKRKNWYAIGAALGILGLMRPQDMLYGLLLIPYVLNHKINLFTCVLSFLIAFSPQMIAWYLTTGHFWQSAYFTHEGFHFFRPHVLGVLLNLKSGLFLWTPITAIGVYGLIQSKRYWMLTVFLAELYVVASWSTWWQGASYSGRMFVAALPILAFGIAELFTLLTKRGFRNIHFLLTIVGPLSVINGINIIYFLLTLH